jgi:hypothetical protein
MITRPTVTRGKVPLHVQEKRQGAFQALHGLLDAISALNLKDLEAIAEGESSSRASTGSSRGKAKVADVNWEDVPFHPVPVTPLSRGPKFSQVRSLGLLLRHP